jgi:hypothetical protein
MSGGHCPKSIESVVRLHISAPPCSSGPLRDLSKNDQIIESLQGTLITEK